MLQNNPENSQLISTLLSAGIAFFGVVLGIIISNITSWRLKSKESRLRILEKIFDKRLKAHEEFLEIPKLMRTTVSDQQTDEKEYFITYPYVLSTKKTFEDFSFKFYTATNFSSHWFEEDLRKEIFFAQDYFQNVQRHLNDIPDENCEDYAKILKTDFKEIADKLEEKILNFLLIDIHKINLNPKNRNFEYHNKDKKERLGKTKLMVNWDEIQGLKK